MFVDPFVDVSPGKTMKAELFVVFLIVTLYAKFSS